MSLPWHARNHQDALDGMLLLTLEERGAYNTILDLIYQRSGPVPDDERWLAGWMGCSVKKWRLIRAALLVKGKLVACEKSGQPALMNERARLELESASTRRRLAAESGAKGGRKTAETNAKPKENNSTGEATLEGSVKLYTVTDTEQDTALSAKAKRADAPSQIDKSKGKRLVPDWQPEKIIGLEDARCTLTIAQAELAKFRDYWAAQPGVKGRKVDWEATWRNWLRGTLDRMPSPPPDRTATVIDAEAIARRREENLRRYGGAS